MVSAPGLLAWLLHDGAIREVDVAWLLSLAATWAAATLGVPAADRIMSASLQLCRQRLLHDAAAMATPPLFVVRSAVLQHLHLHRVRLLASVPHQSSAARAALRTALRQAVAEVPNS